ncbi:glycosyltransferase family 9 protein [Prosthecobacter sp.]|uniref:glycosyltransferase family 9 protein n=1 Tax=Prosthecobacter sp. TaxID=1965333 RepID=UPI003784C7BF
MKILFTKFKHIGDALLLTPTIAAVKRQYPDAEIWVWVRAGTEGILAGCEGIDHLLTSAPTGGGKRSRSKVLVDDIRNLLLVRRQKFDFAFDFSDGRRGLWMAGVSGARFTAVSSADGISAVWSHVFDVCLPYSECGSHRVIKDFNLVRDVLRLDGDIPPLQFTRGRADDAWVKEQRLSGCTVIHPSTRWKRKSWPLERWIELCSGLEKAGHRLVLSSGPSRDEVEFCERIRSGAGLNVVLTHGKLTWAGMAGLLYASRLFVGVDTAAMHLAAACQVPIVALFGPTVEQVWRPWACEHRLVIPQYEENELVRPDGYVDTRLRSMDRIRVAEVAAACQELMQKNHHEGLLRH